MFNGFYITTKGRSLLAKVQTGKVLQFTRFQVGSGALSGQDQSSMVALVSPVSYFPVSALRSNAANAIVSCQIANIGITNEWHFREIGLFANDPDEGEILYAYGNAGSSADLIPSSVENIYECVFSLNCMVGEATEVQAIFDDGLIYATQKYVAETMKKDVEEAVAPYRIIAKDANDDGNVEFEGYFGFIDEEHVESRNNPHGVTAAQVGAAPAGYGLGEKTARVVIDANTATANGFYAMSGDSAINTPALISTFKYGTLLVEVRYSNTIHQTIRYGAHSAVRHSIDGGTSWTEWEYVNPDMRLGVEYRTTERYEGKPVYTQLVAIDQWAKDSAINTGINGYCIRFSGELSGCALPFLNGGTLTNAYSAFVNVMRDSNKLYIYMYGGASQNGNMSGRVQLWYYK